MGLLGIGVPLSAYTLSIFFIISMAALVRSALWFLTL